MKVKYCSQITLMIMFAFLISSCNRRGQTGHWEKLMDMPTGRWMHSAVVINDKIYAIGGIPAVRELALSVVETYHADKKAWKIRTWMPTPRSHLGTSILNGKIYAVGGTFSKPDSSLTTFEVYDIQKDIWSFLPDMPTGRQCVTASVVNGKIYVIGGTTERVPWPGFQTVEVYIPN